ncbi:HEAT repeat domain-containing protein [Cystobacter fuscus]|uniref:HEAT repeat domain-containing protein n=1 Tax=Cystobacter fuscus TaxID=43 RepID=UPI002B2B004C|nr:hypothetical protein F0U63_01015 [Cystobacter fuscus]
MNKNTYEANLREVSWSEFPGAYGPSFEMASHLLAASSREEDTAREAIGMVLGHVCHQQVLAPSAVPAARFLLQLAALREPVHHWLALQAVEQLLESSWMFREAFGFVPRRKEFAGKRPPLSGETLRWAREYDQLSEQLQALLVQHVPHLRGLLGSTDARTRAHAARVLGLVGTRDEASLKSLLAALAAEEDPTVRAVMILSAVLLARHMEPGQLENMPLRDWAASPLLDGAVGTVASLLLEPEQVLALRANSVRRALRAHRLDVDIFPWCDGSPAGLVAEALVLTQTANESIPQLMLEALRYWKEQPEPDEGVFQEWSEFEIIGERLVEQMFGECSGRREFLSREELSPAQRSFLSQLREFLPLIPGVHGLQASGIRSPRRDMPRLLSEVTGGMDQEMCWFWDGRRVSWPLWKWWHQAELVDGWSEDSCFVAREYVLDIMQRQLTPAQLTSAATDVVEGAYDIPPALWIGRVERLA